jgi:hypothetical protein
MLLLLYRELTNRLSQAFGRLVTEPPFMVLAKPAWSALPAVPTFTGKTIESVAIVVTTPVAAMFITIRTAIDRGVPEPTDHNNSRNIDPHSQIRVCLGRNAGTHTCNHKSRAHCN